MKVIKVSATILQETDTKRFTIEWDDESSLSMDFSALELRMSRLPASLVYTNLAEKVRDGTALGEQRFRAMCECDFIQSLNELI